MSYSELFTKSRCSSELLRTLIILIHKTDVLQAWLSLINIRAIFVECDQKS